MYPYRRFASVLADVDARFGASAVRYSFTVGRFHSFQLADSTGALTKWTLRVCAARPLHGPPILVRPVASTDSPPPLIVSPVLEG